MSKDTGGPAFPVMACANESGLIEYHRQGMTLRDYFAAKAMQTFFSEMLSAAIKEEKTPTDGQWLIVAKACYGAADAMLEAREA